MSWLPGTSNYGRARPGLASKCRPTSRCWLDASWGRFRPSWRWVPISFLLQAVGGSRNKLKIAGWCAKDLMWPSLPCQVVSYLDIGWVHLLGQAQVDLKRCWCLCAVYRGGHLWTVALENNVFLIGVCYEGFMLACVLTLNTEADVLMCR